MRMNTSEGKSILALVRGEAFAHAGAGESIELVLGSVTKDPDREVLDVGCGLGGTADYVQQNRWGRVSGFDIDSRTVELAARRYPGHTFLQAEVGGVGSIWQSRFDLLYCFNAFYAFPDQQKALEQLAVTARPGAFFLIFDYTDPDRRYEGSVFAKREDASFWRPIHLDDLAAQAAATGWSLDSSVDLTPEYRRWYADLVRRIEAKKDAVIENFGEELFAFVHAFYVALRDALEDGTLGGGLFRLIRK
jgi:SAM-dependent methyltransferase